ncbi:MAG: hypothetical protein HOV80_01985 [Polyangiaceae bacterium]|nr:hypothetical protein [Polyangiaceae bacterium]
MLSVCTAAGTAFAQPAPQPAQPAQPQPGQAEPGPQPGDEGPLLPPEEEQKAEPPKTPAAEPPKADAKADAAKAAQAKAAADAVKKPTPKGDSTENDTFVFAEDWWMGARPVFEIHGYYRVRAEFLSHFALGRKDTPAATMWPQPPDNDYTDTSSV